MNVQSCGHSSHGSPPENVVLVLLVLGQVLDYAVDVLLFPQPECGELALALPAPGEVEAHHIMMCADSVQDVQGLESVRSQRVEIDNAGLWSRPWVR